RQVRGSPGRWWPTMALSRPVTAGAWCPAAAGGGDSRCFPSRHVFRAGVPQPGGAGPDRLVLRRLLPADAATVRLTHGARLGRHHRHGNARLRRFRAGAAGPARPLGVELLLLLLAHDSLLSPGWSPGAGCKPCAAGVSLLENVQFGQGLEVLEPGVRDAR